METDTRERNFDVVIGSHKPIKMWTRGVPVEDEAMTQLKNMAALPFVRGHVAVMPDVHLGKGATVGSVVAVWGRKLTTCDGNH